VESFSGPLVRMGLYAQSLLDRKDFEQEGEIATCRIESLDDTVTDKLRMNFEVISEEAPTLCQF